MRTSILLRRAQQRVKAGHFNLRHQDLDPWEQRAVDAVALMLRHSTGEPLVVGDLGAGNQRIGRILQQSASDSAYCPYDLHPQQDNVQRLDLRRRMPDQSFDVVFCLGVLEYLPQDGCFAHDVATVTPDVVVSYLPLDGAKGLSRAQRSVPGWTSHYTTAEFEAMFESAGFRALEHRMSADTDLWYWRRNA